MIHHVSVEVNDLDRSGRFYDAVLRPLGWRRHPDPDEGLGGGMVPPIFSAGARPGARAAGGHICFGANGISAVKAAWEGGTTNGGISQGDPGQRPEYGPTYYAAYLRDPDGHRIEITVGID